ncbi:MAG: TetR/AcrR family transcriptional regulator [Crocinitomicaceae bacterium]
MTLSKSEKTSEFIVKRVAPLFNQRGYVGTSMSEITQITGLTKGAIYGNFKNKEELAFEAFAYNVNMVVDKIREVVKDEVKGVDQLMAVVDFYRNYEEHLADLGGCPVLNFGVDANNQNPVMLKRVQEIVDKLQGYIVKMLEVGIADKAIKSNIDTKLYAQKIYTLIQGAVFMAFTMEDSNYLHMMMDHVDDLIEQELKV